MRYFGIFKKSHSLILEKEFYLIKLDVLYVARSGFGPFSPLPVNFRDNKQAFAEYLLRYACRGLKEDPLAGATWKARQKQSQ